MTDRSRREFLKATGGLAGAGALGTLAGCAGGDGGGETPTPTEQGGGDGGETPTPTEQGGGQQETVTLRFLSGLAAESRQTRDHVEQGVKDFESREGNVNVKLEVTSYGDLAQKISSTVQSGNEPDLAEAGAAGIAFFLDGKVADHGSYIEEAEDLPDNWTGATREAASYRGEWWSAGQNRQGTTMMAVRPKLFKSVGVEDPSEFATWTGFRRAVQKVHEEYDDTWAFEQTGVNYDLESYWGEARTAYTGGKEPWIRGDPEDPEVLVGEKPRTDGMIKNTIDLARTYSSPESAKREDEAIPPLMLTDRVASFTSCLATIQRWKQVKSDVQFGWDGDVWTGPHPKLDANYGDEFGIDELAGHEGQHGGHAWALLTQKQVFAKSDHPDLAWKLAYYTNANEDFIVPLVGNIYTSIPSYRPYMETVLERYDPVQMHQVQIEAAQEYGKQYSVTGAAWDLENTDPIRWTAINQTISEAIAGQHGIDETPGLVRERIQERL